jgi:cobalt/nickel transport system permease protein
LAKKFFIAFKLHTKGGDLLKRHQIAILTIIVSFALVKPAYAMHIMEGFLPPVWCISWGLISLPFIIWGYFSIQSTISTNPRLKMLLAMAGALPSFSCS